LLHSSCSKPVSLVRRSAVFSAAASFLRFTLLRQQLSQSDHHPHTALKMIDYYERRVNNTVEFVRQAAHVWGVSVI
jgi:hypothetical protein